MVQERAVAIVDPYSTGEVLAKRVKDQGFKLILVYTIANGSNDIARHSIDFMDAEINYNDDLEKTVAELKKHNVTMVLPGAEFGVLVCDKIMEALKVKVGLNNPLFSEARRSKYVQQEVIRSKGVRAAKQLLATNLDELENFLRDWNPNPYKVIVKPNESAGSDDVFLCKSHEEVIAAYNCINGAINLCGEINKGVLVMEYLEGTEYVVDSVSRNGVNKVVSIWKYDKREANGQFNVYFGMELCPVKSDHEMELIEYANAVLEALQIANGPSHMEIIVTKNGPRLVEVGARCHGGHGTWSAISGPAYGYDQLGATIACYDDKDSSIFDALPAYPKLPKIYGKEVFLVSYREGTIRDMPGLEKVKQLKSFSKIDLGVKVGSKLHKTIDLFTMPGRVQLLHKDELQVERDFLDVHAMLKGGDIFETVVEKHTEAIMSSGPAEN